MKTVILSALVFGIVMGGIFYTIDYFDNGKDREGSRASIMASILIGSSLAFIFLSKPLGQYLGKLNWF